MPPSPKRLREKSDEWRGDFLDCGGGSFAVTSNRLDCFLVRDALNSICDTGCRRDNKYFLMIKKTCLSLDCPERTGGECTAYAPLPMSARTEESELKYQVAKVLEQTVPLDQEEHILDYDHWYLIENRFPYDMIYDEHDMLIPRSGVATREELTLAEAIELTDIIDELSGQYDLVFENFKHRRSVLNLYHVHLASYHRDRGSSKL